MSDTGLQTLLIVDDEANDRFLIERAFRKAQVANPIRAVADGDEAVDYLSGHGKYADRDAYPSPMLVLLDLKMPRRPGLDVLRWIRNSPKHKPLPVVVLTSSPAHEDVQRAYEGGANSYLVKPVDFEGLRKMVETLGLFWLVMSNLPAPSVE